MNETVTRHTATFKRVGPTFHLVGAAVLSFNCYTASAGPLDLDKTFDHTGKVVTNFNLDPGFAQDSASAVAVQPNDQKIVAVGTAHNGSLGYDFALVRYNPNGSVDTTFGTNGTGRVTTDFSSTDDVGVAVLIQPDGNIVVAGTVDEQFGLARYRPNGTLDDSFGAKGLVRDDLGAKEFSHFARGAALQKDGKIVVAGQERSNTNSDFLLVRYLKDGARDTSFGNGGKVITDFGAWDIAWAVAVQTDDKIIAVGSTWGLNFQPVHGALARYKPDGTLDASFNGVGISGALACAMLPSSCGKIKVGLGGGNYDFPVSLAVRKPDGTEDGKIIVAGQFGAARFNAYGGFDADFGNAGIMDKPENTGDAVAILGNDQIVVAGLRLGDFAVALYAPTGERCGSVMSDFNGYADGAHAIVIQSDGKILIAGSADNGTDVDFALARYTVGDCPITIPPVWLGNYLAYVPYVPPWVPVEASKFRKQPYDQLQIGSSEQLVIPASEGGAFAGLRRPGYQAFKLTNVGGEVRQKTPFVTVTNALGDSLLELMEAQQILVPTDIAAERAGGVTASGSRSAPSLKCYSVKMHSGSQRERKALTVTDTLRRTWTIEVGEPESLCRPIEPGGRARTGPAPSLMGYRVKDIKTAGPQPKSARFPTANEFGTRVLQVEQPALVFFPSLAQ